LVGVIIMTNLYLQKIVESIADDILPANWQDFDFVTFSESKKLFDFQQNALRNALKALHLFYKEKQANKAALFELYRNNGLLEDLSYTTKKDSKTLKYLEEYSDDYPEENGKISFEYFINRMSFWMATGSGKTLVIVKLIEMLGELIDRGLLPEKDILFLTYRDDLLDQFKVHVDEFNSYHSDVKINLKNLKEYESVKRANPIPFARNEITVFYYRSDLITDQGKEKQVDFRTYDNHGNWYIVLDEAHKGDRQDSKRQMFYNILSRNGFLFNFSATFTDDRDFATCVYNYNLAEFEKKWEYDLKLHLPSLFEEIGDWKKIRHNYMETLLQMFIDRWSKPYFNYCEENNLIWTGHYWEHNWPDLSQGGDNMAMYAWHQMPGIDMLFNQFNETSPRAQFGNIRAVKELRSAANQVGYKRTLCETYGGGGWDVTFKDMKRLGDWTYVLGVNFMNQHLSHTTLKGARKYDYPPVFTYHSPWWSDYKVLNDYFGRLSAALSNGEQINDLLVIEPTTTLWNYYSYVKGNRTLEQIGQEFQHFITRLEKAQVEYDLGSENIIKDRGSVKKGKFTIGQRSYSTVIIPPLVENIEKHTFDLLADFAKQGGKIISFSVPERLSGELDGSVSEFFKSDNSSIVLLNQLEEKVIRHYFNNSEIQFTDIKGGNLFHQRRKYKDGQLLFLVNSAMKEPTNGMIKAKGKSAVEMDAFTGDLKSYPFAAKNEELSINFNLPPAGSLLLFISNKKIKEYESDNEYINAQIIREESPLEIFPLQENAMKVDFCDLMIKGKEYKNIYFSKAADIAFNEYGFEGNPWNHSIQYKRQIVERDTFQSGGFTVKYYFEIKGDISNNNMKVCVERPEIFEVKINGTKVSPIPDKWFLDKSFPLYDISQWVKPGKNIVEATVEPMSVFAEIEPIYIIGNFTVLPANTGWMIDMKKPLLELGSWKKQGFPFYSWAVGYKKNYQIEDIQKSYKIALPQWNGTVCEVIVNDKKAGIIGFESFELDISDFIKQGENAIEIQVIGSLKNLLGPHFNHPDPGLASP
jgi:hypothetical protein